MNFKLLISILLLIVGFLSCNKNKGQNIDPESGKDYLQAVATFTDVFKQVEIAIKEPSSKLVKRAKDFDTLCMYIRISPNDSTYPKTITIIFDTIYPCSMDGITRTGTIYAVLSEPYKTKGSSVTITFKNYSMNGNYVTGHISGQLLITNKGLNNQNLLVYTIDITGGQIVLPDRNVIYYNGHQTLIWQNGENYTGIQSDLYSMSESSTGTNINSERFSVKTINPITLQINCPYRILSGLTKITPSNGDMLTINFDSTPACSGQAILNTDNLPNIYLNFN